MKKRTGIIVAVAVAALLVIGGAIWYFAARGNDEAPKNAQNVSTDVDQVQGENESTDNAVTNTENNEEQTAQKPAADAQGSAAATGEAEKTVKPTFLYFVKNKDMEGDAVPKVIADLKAEYGDRVVFDIRNIDETGEEMQGFGDTPILFMHDTHNNMCQILQSNANFDDLKAAIEQAFQS